nr:hypothetical protein CFP56_50460 [Quercus suber]
MVCSDLQWPPLFLAGVLKHRMASSSDTPMCTDVRQDPVTTGNQHIGTWTVDTVYANQKIMYKAFPRVVRVPKAIFRRFAVNHRAVALDRGRDVNLSSTARKVSATVLGIVSIRSFFDAMTCLKRSLQARLSTCMRHSDDCYRQGVQSLSYSLDMKPSLVVPSNLSKSHERRQSWLHASLVGFANLLRCSRRGDECVYSTTSEHESRGGAVKRQNEAMVARLRSVATSFQALDDLPDNVVIDVLRLAALAPDPISAFLNGTRNLARSARAIDSAPLHPPDSNSPLAETSQLETELYAEHPLLYRMTQAGLFQIRSEPSNHVFGDSQSHTRNIDVTNDEYVDGHSTAETATLADFYHCLRRLRGLRLQYWTNVPIPPKLAVIAFSSFFAASYAISGAFDADLFMRDLVDCRHDFCSPLLVSAVLSYACKGHQYFRPGRPDLSEMFFQEARAIVSITAIADMSIITLPALIMLANYLFQVQRHDDAMQYSSLALALGRKLQLYGKVDGPPSTSSTTSPDRLRMKSAIAWGSCSWFALWAFFNRNLLPPPVPQLPIFDENVQILPFVAQRVYYARCKFCAILAEVYNQYDWQASPVDGKVTLVFAERSYRRLLRWADDYPYLLDSTHDSQESVVLMRMLFHIVVMDLFRPFTQAGSRLSTFVAPDSSPDAVFMASFKQLQAMILVHSRRHALAGTHGNMVPFLIYTLNANLKNQHGDISAFVLRHCAAILCELSQSFPVAATVLRGIMAMALRHRLVTFGDARAVENRMQQYEQQRDMASCAARSTFVLDFDHTTPATDVNKTVDALADEFQSRLAFYQFTADGDLSGKQTSSI